MVLPLIPILIGTSAFFGGAYVGTAVDNANQAPSTVITTEKTTVNQLSNIDILKYGALGVAAFFIYAKYIKGKPK